ncbi:Ig domain-containing protein [Candidatus Enterococcus mansonii]|uniref:Clostridial hydrophobic W n=1 Tax=Candidatus Enterococcus mansonii TaxID=1834181 RepID=A0A242CID4_9ENTE|nr:Ig domain-containing protein [Enterococcus sp. 4G2_DIV0659]OTO10004.1 hypothetical protein A5880_000687 [Enterococcus sp. 4G2_DIV0659]
MRKIKVFLTVLFVGLVCVVLSPKVSKAEEFLNQNVSRTAQEQQELLDAIPKGYKLVESSGLERGIHGNLYGKCHVQNYGWSNSLNVERYYLGTTGQALRLEALALAFSNNNASIKYRLHIQNLGWQGWSSNGSVNGTTGRGLRAEAVQISASGLYRVMYRTHIQKKGWTGWSQNGQISGTTGQALRMEAIDIALIALI